MSTSEWTLPPSVKGPQVGQVIAGRYRLALFKGGDDIAEVWHAVEESTQQVVTVEILRDRTDAALRKRFLEQAHRMAEIERPSVMKVVGIHDEENETFVVFEHLIPLALELPELGAVEATSDVELEVATVVRPEPAAAVAPPLAPAQTVERTATVEHGVTAETTETVAALPLHPIVPASELEPASPLVQTNVVETAVSQDAAPTVVIRRPESLQVPRSLELAMTDVSVLVTYATRFGAQARIQLLALYRETPMLRDGVARLAQRARPLIASARPVIASARPLIDRVRHNQIAMAGVVGTLILVVFIASPLDDAISGALRPAATPAPTIAPTAAPLTRAPFELPPLGAYAAAFESQAPFPTATPNANVEWVVALRNTGSAGWYRGISGAQVALALTDGTGVAVQTTPYVAPGQVGWFVVRLKARAVPGNYTVPLVPRVDGLGPLPDLGIHAVVIVLRSP